MYSVHLDARSTDECFLGQSHVCARIDEDVDVTLPNQPWLSHLGVSSSPAGWKAEIPRL